MPGHHVGRIPPNKGRRYPADPPTIDEIVAVMRQAAARGDPAATDPAPARARVPLGHRDYLEGISSEEISGAMHGRKAPMMHASATLEL
jgi:hypothetical protein